MYDWKDSRIISHWNRKHAYVTLTFDDGPGRQLLPILNVLKQFEVPAVFFWQGRLIHQKRPYQQVLDDGHLIGTHSFKHRLLIKLTLAEQQKDIGQSKAVIEQLIGQPITYFRPPFGRYNDDTLAVARELGLRTMNWSIAGWDWDYPNRPEEIVRHIENHVQGGDIILLHELEQTVVALPDIIRKVREKGLHFVLPTDPRLDTVAAPSVG